MSADGGQGRRGARRWNGRKRQVCPISAYFCRVHGYDQLIETFAQEAAILRPNKVEEVAAGSDSGEALKAELDDLLDEIDDVLETNAEDFVKSYIQKGGQ